MPSSWRRARPRGSGSSGSSRRSNASTSDARPVSQSFATDYILCAEQLCPADSHHCRSGRRSRAEDGSVTVHPLDGNALSNVSERLRVGVHPADPVLVVEHRRQRDNSASRRRSGRGQRLHRLDAQPDPFGGLLGEHDPTCLAAVDGNDTRRLVRWRLALAARAAAGEGDADENEDHREPTWTSSHETPPPGDGCAGPDSGSVMNSSVASRQLPNAACSTRKMPIATANATPATRQNWVSCCCASLNTSAWNSSGMAIARTRLCTSATTESRPRPRTLA